MDWALSSLPHLDYPQHAQDPVVKADLVHQAPHLACRRIQDLNTTTAQLQGLTGTIMLHQSKTSTIYGQPILQLPAMAIQKIYMIFDYKEQIVYKEFAELHMDPLLPTLGQREHKLWCLTC